MKIVCQEKLKSTKCYNCKSVVYARGYENENNVCCAIECSKCSCKTAPYETRSEAMDAWTDKVLL